MQGIADFDVLKKALANYEESHLQRYPERWLDLAIVYLDVKICLTELIDNIFKHGYPDQQTKPLVVINVQGLADRLEVEITDNAIPFDSSSANGQRFLANKLVDRLDYQRLATGNRVTFLKQTTRVVR